NDDHNQQLLPPTTGLSVTISAPAPANLAVTRTSYLEIELTATDSHGLTNTVTRILRPWLVDITFAAIPAGLILDVHDTCIAGPQRLTSWAGYRLIVLAPPQLDRAGHWMALDSWWDGATDAARSITTPSSTAAYTATFAPTHVLFFPIIRSVSP